MVAVAEGGGRKEDILGGGAVEDGDAAARDVRVAVVQVEEERGVAGVAGEDLRGEGGEDAAAGRAIRGVVRDGFRGVSGETGKFWAAM